MPNASQNYQILMRPAVRRGLIGGVLVILSLSYVWQGERSGRGKFGNLRARLPGRGF